jgi:hypothetical protein
VSSIVAIVSESPRSQDPRDARNAIPAGERDKSHPALDVVDSLAPGELPVNRRIIDSFSESKCATAQIVYRIISKVYG